MPLTWPARTALCHAKQTPISDNELLIVNLIPNIDKFDLRVKPIEEEIQYTPQLYNNGKEFLDIQYMLIERQFCNIYWLYTTERGKISTYLKCVFS